MKLKAALIYAEEFKFSVIPCSEKKKPYFDWKKYQKEKASSDQIKAWWKQYPRANPAIVTGSISGICVIDIDTEEGMEAIKEYIPEGLEMPIVSTPRGKHLWFHANGNCLRNHAGIIPGIDFRGEGGYIMAPPSEAWSEHGEEAKFGKYEWIVSIRDCAPPSLPNIYIKHITNSVLYNNIYNISKNNAKPANLFKQGRRDDDLFHTANCLVKGGMHQEGIQQIIEILADNCQPPMPKKEAWQKVQSALIRDDRRYENLAGEVRDFVISSFGVISSSDFVKFMDISSISTKKNVSKAFSRLVEEGIIERVKGKNGNFRRIENECDEIDFLHASTEEYPIKFPFKLEEYVKILPGNIIVIAGEANAGKSAFCINIAAMNMGHLPVHYFSSEMVGSELRERLSKSEIPLANWKIKVWERVEQFHDVIKPDALNIIDYLEEAEEPFKIAARITQIHMKLKQGVAVIALQKPKGRDEGVGGRGTLEKPRLYLAIGRKEGENIIKIVKAKNRKQPNINPNNMILKFKLYDGIKFEKTVNWMPEV